MFRFHPNVQFYKEKDSEKLVSHGDLDKQSLDSNPAGSGLLPSTLSPHPVGSNVLWEQTGRRKTSQAEGTAQGAFNEMVNGSERPERVYVLKERSRSG